MSKKKKSVARKRNKKAQKREAAKRKKCMLNRKGFVPPSFDNRMKDILDAEVLPLTDDLIEKLVSEGHERKNVEFFRDEGMGYCPDRNSFMDFEWQSSDNFSDE